MKKQITVCLLWKTNFEFQGVIHFKHWDHWKVCLNINFMSLESVKVASWLDIRLLKRKWKDCWIYSPSITDSGKYHTGDYYCCWSPNRPTLLLKNILCFIGLLFLDFPFLFFPLSFWREFHQELTMPSRMAPLVWA